MVVINDGGRHVWVRGRHGGLRRDDHAGLVPIATPLAVLTQAVSNRRGVRIVVAEAENAPVLLGIDAAVDAVELLCLIFGRVILAHQNLPT